MALIFLFSNSLAYSQVLVKAHSLTTLQPALATDTLRICVPSRVGLMQKPPLYIIKYGKKEYSSNRLGYNLTSEKLFKPDDIASLNISRDSTTKVKYGPDTKNGIVIITIKEDKVPQFKKKLKKYKAEFE